MALTEKAGAPWYYDIHPRVKWVNFDINFDELDVMPFYQKVWHYYLKQRKFKRMFSDYLMQVRPDITVSICRREINFITDIEDGSKKIGELHVNRANYRNFKTENVSILKRVFAKFWSANLVSHLKKLDKLVVLTEKDREAWTELNNVVAIPDPLSFKPTIVSSLTKKRVCVR